MCLNSIPTPIEKHILQSMNETVPFALETKLIERGATIEKADPFKKQTVADQRLVTGQNPVSAKDVAAKTIRLLDGSRSIKSE